MMNNEMLRLLILAALVAFSGCSPHDVQVKENTVKIKYAKPRMELHQSDGSGAIYISVLNQEMEVEDTHRFLDKFIASDVEPFTLVYRPGKVEFPNEKQFLNQLMILATDDRVELLVEEPGTGIVSPFELLARKTYEEFRTEE